MECFHLHLSSVRLARFPCRRSCRIHVHLPSLPTFSSTDGLLPVKPRSWIPQTIVSLLLFYFSSLFCNKSPLLLSDVFRWGTLHDSTVCSVKIINMWPFCHRSQTCQLAVWVVHDTTLSTMWKKCKPRTPSRWNKHVQLASTEGRDDSHFHWVCFIL